MHKLLMLFLVSGLNSAKNYAQSTATLWKVDAIYGSFGGFTPWSLPRDNAFFNFRLTGSYTMLFRNGLTLSLRAHNGGFGVLNPPQDYYPGTNSNFLGNIGSGRPPESMDAFSFGAGYKVHPFHSPLFRIGAEAGPALVNYRRLHFTPQPVTIIRSSSFFGPDTSANYSSATRCENHFGVATAVRIEAPLSRYVGLEFGVWKVFNSAIPLAGTETSLTFGLVRRRIDPKGAGRL